MPEQNVQDVQNPQVVIVMDEYEGPEVVYKTPDANIVIIDMEDLGGKVYDGPDGIREVRQAIAQLRSLPNFGRPRAQSRRDELIEELEGYIDDASY